MDEKERKRRQRLAMNAAMEGEQAVIANMGEKVTVSSMELIVLVNFAEIGVMSLFGKLDGDTGRDARRSLKCHLDAVRETFARKEGDDGLARLSQSAAALLRSEKFSRYLPGKRK